jgi:hypothetical protein
MCAPNDESLTVFVVEFRQLLILHYETSPPNAKADTVEKLSVMFAILNILERGEADVQTIRQTVARLRGEKITSLYFVFAMDVLARRGSIVNGRKMGFWKLGEAI